MKIDRYWRALALAMSVTAAGCGPELLGGAQNGEVRAAATSDESGGSSSAAPAAGPSLSTSGSTSAAASGIEGEITVAASVWLITADGDQVPVQADRVPGTFRIETADESQIARGDVRAQSYVGVLVEFTSVVAIVEGGLTIGGTPIIGAVTVNMAPAGRVIVQRPVDLTVEPRTTNGLVIDLNSHVWLPATVLPSRTVPAAVFAAAVEIRRR